MDICVTVPLSFGLYNWVSEGDPAGSQWSGAEWDFYLWGTPPAIEPGERVYVVYNGKLRGYAPLVRISRQPWRGSRAYSLVRHGDAVAVTIDERIHGFRGWRPRHWDYVAEHPFPGWRIP